jgi:hypothetical protein
LDLIRIHRFKFAHLCQTDGGQDHPALVPDRRQPLFGPHGARVPGRRYPRADRKALPDHLPRQKGSDRRAGRHPRRTLAARRALKMAT